MKRSLKIVLQIFFILLILGGAVAVTVTLIKTKPTADKTTPPKKVTPVNAITVQPTSKRVSVRAMGNVIPARAVVIQPEVGGRIIYQNKRLVPGGKFRSGEIIARIDPRDYKLALSQQKAGLAQAEFQLKVEQGRKAVAEYEWSLIDEKDRPQGEAKDLTLRDPHIQNTRAALEAAKSGLERAQLSVKRTVLHAPFNGMIRDETVEKGQLVSPQSRLATLVGTDEFWVQISVPVERLDWFDVPGLGAEQGSEVRIIHNAGPGKRIERTGRVVRLLGDLDPRGRMAQLIVSVKDPLALKEDGTETMPLLLGSYVSVEIPGRELADVYEVPRTALRGGNQVWVVKNDSTLDIRDVEVVWRDDNTVYVRRGLSASERIITSRIGAPIAGMALKVAGMKQAESKVEPVTKVEAEPEAEGKKQ
ncbi:MAG: efflux RND transporter periplasmic adaptor subunit [Deltaproteobacteria bacterium]|nr:efflux RND transporter periplasmic adaptor subunit [Deltaproteobacteria bacterium]